VCVFVAVGSCHLFCRSSLKQHVYESGEFSDRREFFCIFYQQTVDCWWPSFSGRLPTDMEWPPGRRDISRIIFHILSHPRDTSVQEVFSWLLAGHQL